MSFDATTKSEDVVHYKRRRRVDRGVGYLVGTVVVLLSFLLSMIGMRWVQSMSDQATAVRLDPPEPRSAEIGDSTDHGPAGTE